MNAQSSPASSVVAIKPGRGAILGDGDIGTAVAIKITGGRSSLFPGDMETALRRFERAEAAMAVAEHLKAILEGSSQLLGQHLALARLELREDAKVMVGHFARIAIFALLLVVGYGFLCASAAGYLARYRSADLAFALVGLANVIAGGVGIYATGQRLKGRVPMAETMEQAERTARVLQGSPTPQGEPHA